MNCELKDLALRNKASMEGLISDDDNESCYEQRIRWDVYTNYDDAYEINHDGNEEEELCEVYEPPVCNIRKYRMIKYSFNNNEDCVVIKEDENDDLTITRKEAYLAYQEIFQKKDEGWKDLVKEISTHIGGEFSNLEDLEVLEVLYKVEDVASYLVEYVKFWDDWEVDHYGNANLDHGKKRPRESNASSSSTTLNHPSSSRPLDDTIDENDDASFHSNYSSLSQNVSSSSNVVPRVRQNPPHESL
ncbi:hypothetical protein Tco_0009572 [Tanacetum coccineum]